MKDDIGDVVVGIISAASLEQKDSYAIPAALLADAWPTIIHRPFTPHPSYGVDSYGPAGGEFPVRVPRPHELPLAPPDFSGRSVEKKQLIGWLTAGQEPRIVNIYGMPGSGKSALALNVAELLSTQYPECQIYFNLRSGSHVPVAAASLLGGKLVQLGVPANEIPSGLEELAQAYRSRISRMRSIIMVDNASSAVQVEPLLPGGGSRSVVIVTSWALISELAGTHALALPPLGDDEALEMLSSVSQRGVTETDRAAVQHVIQLVGNLPIALRIAGGLMRKRPHWTWEILRSKLSGQPAENLVLGSPELQASFDLAYRELAPNVAEGYRFLGLAPASQMDAELAQLLISSDPRRAEDVFDELVDHQFLQPDSTLTVRMHDLLWLRARTLLSQDPDNEGQQAARNRMTQWSLDQLDDRYLPQLQASLRYLPSVLEQEELIPLEATYIDSTVIAADSRVRLGSITDVFPAQRRLVLLAPGAMGKTTMAGHLCLTAAAHRQTSKDGNPIPLIMLVRDFVSGQEEVSLEPLIIRTLRYRYSCELTPEALHIALNQGSIFLVADGLDEIIEPSLRQRVIESINVFAEQYPQVPMLVTTRPFSGLQDALPGFSAMTIAPWSRKMARKYLLMLTSDEVHGTVGIDIQDLMNSMETYSDPSVVGTPLGLQMLLSHFQRTGEVPRSFTFLVEKIMSVLAYYRESVRGLSSSDDDIPIARSLLENIAFKMQSSTANRTTITRRALGRISVYRPELIHWLTNRSGILTETGMTAHNEQLIAFVHTAFREHLAASHLARMPVPEVVDVMQKHFADPSWESVFMTALELGNAWHSDHFARDVEAASHNKGERFACQVRSWIAQATAR
jgi:hypothetical protein